MNNKITKNQQLIEINNKYENLLETNRELKILDYFKNPLLAEGVKLCLLNNILYVLNNDMIKDIKTINNLYHNTISMYFKYIYKEYSFDNYFINLNFNFFNDYQDDFYDKEMILLDSYKKINYLLRIINFYQKDKLFNYLSKKDKILLLIKMIEENIKITEEKMRYLQTLVD